MKKGARKKALIKLFFEEGSVLRPGGFFAMEFLNYLLDRGYDDHGFFTVDVSYSVYKNFVEGSIGVVDERLVVSNYLRFLSYVLSSYPVDYDDYYFDEKHRVVPVYFIETENDTGLVSIWYIEDILSKANRQGIPFGFICDVSNIEKSIKMEFFSRRGVRYSDLGIADEDEDDEDDRRIFFNYSDSPLDRALITLSLLRNHFGNDYVYGYIPSTGSGDNYVVYVGSIHSMLEIIRRGYFCIKSLFPNDFFYYPTPLGSVIFIADNSEKGDPVKTFINTMRNLGSLGDHGNFDFLLDLLNRTKANREAISELLSEAKAISHETAFHPVVPARPNRIVCEIDKFLEENNNHNPPSPPSPSL